MMRGTVSLLYCNKKGYNDVQYVDLTTYENRYWLFIK